MTLGNSTLVGAVEGGYSDGAGYGPDRSTKKGQVQGLDVVLNVSFSAPSGV